MAAGATETFTLDASVAAAKGPLTLMARSEALSGITDSNPANNSYTLNATVVPLAADLEVSVTNLDHSGSQTRLAYEVMVKNITGLAADGAVVISPVVAGVKKLAVLCVSNSASARNLLGGYAECPANPTVLQIEQGLAIPRLGAGSTITFRIDAIATISGNQTLSASATPPSGMSDPVVSNNSATAVVATIGETPGNADVSIVIVKRPPPGKNMVGFEVNVRNAGPDPASLTVIRVPAVAGTTVALENCAVPLYATTPVKAQCPFNLTVAGLATGLEIPWFPANSSLTFTIDLKLPTSSGTVTLSANATVPKGGTDPDPKNNSAHATATIP
jgi:hypothetical protein